MFLVRIYYLFVSEPVFAPCSFQQVATSENAARVFQKNPQDIELLDGELNRGVADRHREARWIEDDIAPSQGVSVRAPRLQGLRSPQHRLDALDDEGHRERLRDVVVRKRVEALHLACIVIERGEHDDGDVAFRADDLAYREAVRLWEHDVKEDEVGEG